MGPGIKSRVEGDNCQQKKGGDNGLAWHASFFNLSQFPVYYKNKQINLAKAKPQTKLGNIAMPMNTKMSGGRCTCMLLDALGVPPPTRLAFEEPPTNQQRETRVCLIDLRREPQNNQEVFTGERGGTETGRSFARCHSGRGPVLRKD